MGVGSGQWNQETGYVKKGGGLGEAIGINIPVALQIDPTPSLVALHILFVPSDPLPHYPIARQHLLIHQVSA